MSAPALSGERVRSAWGAMGRAWWGRLLLGLVVLTVAMEVADTPDLISQGSVGAALRFAAPILLAGLGGLWAERCGVLNIGLDGMMIMGTWTGAWAGLEYGPWAALLGGMVGGGILGMLHALICVTFAVDQTISGLAINLAAIGLVRFLSSLVFADLPGGSISQSPQLGDIPEVSVPGVEALVGPLAEGGVPVLSQAASLVLGVLVDVSLFTVLAAAMVPATWWVVQRTRLGLRVRASGENPAALEALGVDPLRIRWVALTLSGAFAGLGGAYLVTVASNFYREGQVAGRGFIGLATMVFGNWQPSGVAMGSLLFGFTDALRTRQESTVRALLLVAGVALLVVAGREVRRDRARRAASYAVVAVALLAWFLLTDTFPSEFVGFAPHVATLLVLALAHQNLRPPAALAVPFRRGQQR